VYSAIQDVSVLDGMRQLVKGQPIKSPKAGQASAVSGIVSSTNASFGQIAAGGVNDLATATAIAAGPRPDIANAAMKYQGVPYVWGGQTPSGWDCSGMVYWVLHHDLGIPMSRMISDQYRVWTKASNVPRANIGAGDLCCYTGHIGIAISNSQYISAQSPATGTKVGNIDWSMTNPVQGRRVTAAITAPSATGGPSGSGGGR
jgi:cell wall-associated NlpC family hydrolase